MLDNYGSMLYFCSMNSVTADLFPDDPATPPIARKNDPKTSHQAAAEYSATNRKRHKDILRDLIAEFPNRTTNELARILETRGYDSMTAIRIPNKRVSDLIADDVVVVSGARKCSRTGKRCRTYTLSPCETS